jgi:hypothetical protein
MLKLWKTFFLLFLIVICCPQKYVWGWHGTLSDRASNPITNLSQLQFENDFSPENDGCKDNANQISIKPIIALNKTDGFPFEQLIRAKVQIPTLPNSPKTRRGTFLGDTQLFDLFIKEEPSWGRWGIGPIVIFPTATVAEAGQGKWQIGPAAGLSVLKFKRWQFGFLAQNPISFAGSSRRARQNFLLFQPFVIYHFLKNAYFISNGEWTIDWLNHTKQIPVNIGVGYTAPLLGLKIDSVLQFEWMAYQDAVKTAGFVNQYTVQFSFSILFD